MYFDRGNAIEPNFKLYYKPTSKDEVYASIIGELSSDNIYLPTVSRCVCGKIIRRNLLMMISARFQEGLYIGEDAMFLMELLRYAKQEDILVLNEYGYYYRLHNSSAVARYKNDLLQQTYLQEERLNHNLGLIYGNNQYPNIVKDARIAFLWQYFLIHHLNYIVGIKRRAIKVHQNRFASVWLKEHRKEMLGSAWHHTNLPNTKDGFYRRHQRLSEMMGKFDNPAMHIVMEDLSGIYRYFFKM